MANAAFLIFNALSSKNAFISYENSIFVIPAICLVLTLVNIIPPEKKGAVYITLFLIFLINLLDKSYWYSLPEAVQGIIIASGFTTGILQWIMYVFRF